ncbi:MAG: mercury(II) reductase [Rhodospirillales bacterium]|jgi:mercury(II) reductase|nr:mercury(II) reductase [Rhodospirillales bacterium]MDP7214800.1 mercury(II) reductase [Rhodospirillales bacterium]HIJ44380.1 mercury(II) reductase [Rhodospirillaceae bacterium]HIJ93475.1 mercury(II) reductase [Rhodospirillaceae bacterium]HJP53483.1 mercury(II) reductase [Rhodospirillales bacterium]
MTNASRGRFDTFSGDNGETFDLAVIGAGSAGFSAAIRAAELGARIVLIGDGTIGGTCVNVGCVPSKALIRATETLHQARAASRFAGIRVRADLEDWRALIAQKDELIASLRQAKYRDILPSYDTIAYRQGAARLSGGGVAVNGTLLRPGKIIVATGASATLPPIPGIEDVACLTSTTALKLDRLPTSMLVIGGGFIGCELAQMFARTGVQVTILCRSRLLPEAEPEIGEALTGYFRDEGICVRDGIDYQGIRKTADGVVLAIGVDGVSETIEAERVLAAAGRRPNTQGLGLADGGVELTGGGGIKVDEWLCTTNPAVYAAGDVTGRDMFVYMAAYGAKVAAENALNGDSRRYDAAATPSVTFTDPQAACVGLTEAAARRQGLNARTSTLSLAHLPRALAARDKRGLIKLVAEAGTGRLLGAHILAPEGGDSIQTAALAIKQGLTVTDLADTIFPYLTTVEGLKLAALAFTRDVSKLSCCAG